MFSRIKKCVVTLLGKDDKDVRLQQVTANGVPDDAEIYAPYGMSYNLPEGCLCLHIQLSEDEGDVVILPDRSKDRIKGLKRGEVAFFNPLTKSRTIYRENGDVGTVVNGRTELTSKGDVVTNANFVSVSDILAVGSGATGSFSSGDGKVITVQDGIITGIV